MSCPPSPSLCDSESLSRMIDWLYNNELGEYEILFRNMKINEFELAFRWEPSDIYRILKIRVPRHFNSIVRHKYELLFCSIPDLEKNNKKNKNNIQCNITNEEEDESPNTAIESNKDDSNENK